jgi:hypothetical protein
VNVAAFETDSEAILVDALRVEAQPTISLVAERDGCIIGHILFSSVTLIGCPNIQIMGLAPMAVLRGERGGIHDRRITTRRSPGKIRHDQVSQSLFHIVALVEEDVRTRQQLCYRPRNKKPEAVDRQQLRAFLKRFGRDSNPRPPA